MTRPPHVLAMPPLSVALRTVFEPARLWVPRKRAVLEAREARDEPHAKRQAVASAINPFMPAHAEPVRVHAALGMHVSDARCANVVLGRGVCNEPLPTLDALRAAVKHASVVTCVSCGHVLIRATLVDQTSGSDARSDNRSRAHVANAIGGFGGCDDGDALLVVYAHARTPASCDSVRWRTIETPPPPPPPANASANVVANNAAAAALPSPSPPAVVPRHVPVRAKRRSADDARGKAGTTLRMCVADMRAVMERVGCGDAAAVQRLEERVLARATAFMHLLRERIQKLNADHHLNGLALFAALACGVPCIAPLLPAEKRDRYAAALANVQRNIANESMRSKLFLPNLDLARNLLYMLVHHGAAHVPALDADGTLLTRACIVAHEDVGAADAAAAAAAAAAAPTWTLWRLCEHWLRVLHISGLFDRLSSGEVNQDVHSNPLRAARMHNLLPAALKQQRPTVHRMRLQLSTATEAVAVVLCMIQSAYLPFHAAAEADRAARRAPVVDGPTDSDEDALVFAPDAPALPSHASATEPLLPIGDLFRLLEVKPSAVKSRIYCVSGACAVQNDSTIADGTVLSLNARMQACGLAPVHELHARFGGRSRMHSYLTRVGTEITREQRAARAQKKPRVEPADDAQRRGEQQTAFRMLRKMVHHCLHTGDAETAQTMAATPREHAVSVEKATLHMRQSCASSALPAVSVRTSLTQLRRAQRAYHMPESAE